MDKTSEPKNAKYKILEVGLMFGGTYSTAVSVANDMELRKSIRRSVKEFEFLDNIGHTEMELEIKKKVFSTMNVLSSQLKQETGIDSSLKMKLQSTRIWRYAKCCTTIQNRWTIASR